jgi:hypothetical protein
MSSYGAKRAYVSTVGTGPYPALVGADLRGD